MRKLLISISILLLAGGSVMAQTSNPSATSVSNQAAGACMLSAKSIPKTLNSVVDTRCSLVAFEVCISKTTGYSSQSQEAKKQCAMIKEIGGATACLQPCIEVLSLSVGSSGTEGIFPDALKNVITTAANEGRQSSVIGSATNGGTTTEKPPAQSQLNSVLSTSDSAALVKSTPSGNSGSTGGTLMDMLGKAPINSTVGTITSAVSGATKNNVLGQLTGNVLQSALISAAPVAPSTQPNPNSTESASASGSAVMDVIGKASIANSVGAITSAVSAATKNTAIGQLTGSALQSALSLSGEPKPSGDQMAASTVDREILTNSDPQTNNAHLGTGRTFTIKGLDRLNKNQPGGQITVSNHKSELIGTSPIDSIVITADGAYTFPTSIGNNATFWRIKQPNTNMSCVFTKGKQRHLDPYTGQFPDADIYCYEKPCGDILTLGNAPPPKGLTVNINPDLSVTVSFVQDPWASNYNIYYSRDPRVVVNNQLTNFVMDPSGGPSTSTPTIRQPGTIATTTIVDFRMPKPEDYYFAVTSHYTAPTTLNHCQSQASPSVRATRTLQASSQEAIAKREPAEVAAASIARATTTSQPKASPPVAESGLICVEQPSTSRIFYGTATIEKFCYYLSVKGSKVFQGLYEVFDLKSKQLLESRTWVDGKLSGRERVYYFDRSSPGNATIDRTTARLYEEGDWLNGEKVGTWNYYFTDIFDGVDGFGKISNQITWGVFNGRTVEAETRVYCSYNQYVIPVKKGQLQTIYRTDLKTGVGSIVRVLKNGCERSE